MLVWLLTGALCIGASLYGIYAANEQSKRNKIQRNIASQPTGEEVTPSVTKSRPHPPMKEKSRCPTQEGATRKSIEKDGPSHHQDQWGRHKESTARFDVPFPYDKEVFSAAHQRGAHAHAVHKNNRKHRQPVYILHEDGHPVIGVFPEKLRLSQGPRKSALYKLVSETARESSPRRAGGRGHNATKKGVRVGQYLAKAKA